MSKGGKTGGGPQPSAPGILPGGGPLTSSSPGKGGRGMPPQQQEPSGWRQPPAQQFGGGWGQPQFQGGFGGYGQGLQRPSGPGKGGPFQGPGPSYNQPQMPFGYGQMQYSPQRFHGYGVPSSMAQPFPDIQLPPPGYPQQYGRQPGMGGPGKGGRRRGPPPYMGGRGLGGPGYDPWRPRHEGGPSGLEQRGGGGISYGAGEHRRMAESARDGGFSPQQMREQQLYAAGQQQQEEYGQAGGYAQMLRKLGRPGGQYTPSQADEWQRRGDDVYVEPLFRTAYSGGGGIAGIYGPGGRVR